MRSLLQLLLFTGLLLPITTLASHPFYVRLTGGQLYFNQSENQTIYFSPAYWKTNRANHHGGTDLYGGLSAGWRLPLSAHLEAELGGGFYQAASHTQTGKVYQYSSQDFYNMDYTYQIHHQRLMAEGKLLTTYANIFHPYFSLGLGISRNRSNDYHETPRESYAVPDPALTAATKTNFAYSAGMGVDTDVTTHWRVGMGYEFSHLGKAKLGKAPTQIGSQQLDTGNIKASQLMFQVTYAG